jgi:hypothetical protein
MAAPNPGPGSRGMQPSSSVPRLTITSPAEPSSQPGPGDALSPNSMRSGRSGRFGSMVTMNAILRDMSSLSLDQQDLGEFGGEPDHPEFEEDDENGPLWMGDDTTPRHSSRSPAAHASPARSMGGAAAEPLAGRERFWTDRLPPGYADTSPQTSLSRTQSEEVVARSQLAGSHITFPLNLQPFGVDQPMAPGFPHTISVASSSRTQSGEVAAGSRRAGSQLASPFLRPFGMDLNTPAGWQPMPPGWPSNFGDMPSSMTQSGPLTASSQLAIPPNQLPQRMSQSPAHQQTSRSLDRRALPTPSHASATSRAVSTDSQLANPQDRMRLPQDERAAQRQASRARSAEVTAASQLVQLGDQGGSRTHGRRRQRSGACESQERQTQRQRCQREDSASSMKSANSAVRGSSVDSIEDLDRQSRASSATRERNQDIGFGETCAASKIQGGSSASSKIQGGSSASSKIQGGSSASSKRSQNSSSRGDNSQQGGCAQGVSEQDSRHPSPDSRRDRDTSSDRLTRHDRDRRRDRAEVRETDESVARARSVERSRERSRDQDLHPTTRRSPRLLSIQDQGGSESRRHAEEHTDSTFQDRQRRSSGKGKGKARRSG